LKVLLLIGGKIPKLPTIAEISILVLQICTIY